MHPTAHPRGANNKIRHPRVALGTVEWVPGLKIDCPRKITNPYVEVIDTVSEWLRRWTRNPLGSARRGSNPLGVAHLRV